MQARRFQRIKRSLPLTRSSQRCVTTPRKLAMQSTYLPQAWGVSPYRSTQKATAIDLLSGLECDPYLILVLHEKLKPFVEQRTALWRAHLVTSNTRGNLFLNQEDLVSILLDICRVQCSHVLSLVTRLYDVMW